MHLPRLNSAPRLLAGFLMAGLLSTTGWTQTSQNATPAALPAAPSAQRSEIKDYTKPRSHFPNPIGPYLPRHVPPPDLNNTPRVGALIQNGKVMLSLNDAIALALENNLDIAIARYNLNIADTDILLANAGQSTRGVNTGVVQGTPGGGVIRVARRRGRRYHHRRRRCGNRKFRTGYFYAGCGFTGAEL